jgi:hypothetical protein
MNEAEKQKVISELNDFYKGLQGYKKRQLKRQDTGFSEPQIRSLDAFRLELQRKYGRLEEIISQYGGTPYITRLGERRESFHYILSSLDIKSGTFVALDGAISAVNKAIGKLESVSLADKEQQRISIITQAIKASPTKLWAWIKSHRIISVTITLITLAAAIITIVRACKGL